MKIYDYATNAACLERPSWHIHEVGYDWAKIVFKNHKSMPRYIRSQSRLRGRLILLFKMASNHISS